MAKEKDRMFDENYFKKIARFMILATVFVMIGVFTYSVYREVSAKRGGTEGEPGKAPEAAKQAPAISQPVRITCDRGACSEVHAKLTGSWSPVIYIPPGYGPKVMPDEAGATVKVRINDSDAWVYTKDSSLIAMSNGKPIMGDPSKGIAPWLAPPAVRIQVMAADDASIGKGFSVYAQKNP